jgi:hypothetical protein
MSRIRSWLDPHNGFSHTLAALPMRYLLALTIVAALMLIPAERVSACSASFPTIQSMTAGSEVVAIGTLVNPTPDVITLKVEEHLKGGLQAPTLRLNNHFIGNDESCRQSLGEGNRFRGGDRVLVFLQRDEFKVGSDWRPTGLGAGFVLRIANDQLSFGFGQLPLGSLPEAKAQIATLVGAAGKGRCFDVTGLCIDGRFLEWWQQNGGETIFGEPVSSAYPQTDPRTGKSYLTQWFERGRFTLRPDRKPPADVELGPLGREWNQQVRPGVIPRERGPRAGCLWFAETGFNVCDQGVRAGFKSFWQSLGLQTGQQSAYGRSLALFGLPLSPARVETNVYGLKVFTQWFERARFEWTELEPGVFQVRLGRLGTEFVDRCGPPLSNAHTGKADFRYGGEGGFCVVWKDMSPDERGFRVRLTYGANKQLTYTTPANTTQFVLPKPAAALTAPQPCSHGKYNLSVYALRPRGTELVGSVDVVRMCPSVEHNR